VPGAKGFQVFSITSQWIKYPKTTRKIEDRDLKQKIITVYHNNRRTYGSPRIHQTLLRDGYHVSKKRVERLMKEAGIYNILKNYLKFCIKTI